MHNTIIDIFTYIWYPWRSFTWRQSISLSLQQTIKRAAKDKMPESLVLWNEQTPPVNHTHQTKLGAETQILLFFLFFFSINPHSSHIYIFAATQYFYFWLPKHSFPVGLSHFPTIPSALALTLLLYRTGPKVWPCSLHSCAALGFPVALQ